MTQHRQGTGAWPWEELVLARRMALGKLFLPYEVIFFLIYLNYSLSSHAHVL